LNNHFESGNAINFELAFLNLLCALFKSMYFFYGCLCKRNSIRNV